MSRGLVSARPFAKKRTNHSLKRAINRTGIPLPSISLSISQKAKEILSWSVIGAILLICWFLFLIKGVFFKPEFRIEQVKFSQTTEQTFYDIELFNLVTKELKGKNFYMLQYFQKDKILHNIQRVFPFVSNISFQMEAKSSLTGWDEIEETLSESEILEILSSTGDANEMESLGTGEEQPIGTGGIEGENEGTGISESVVVEKPKSTPPSVNGGILGVELTFEEPVLKVKLGGKEFWIWDDEHFLEIKEGLLIGAETFVIDTPQYLTGTTSLSWFFYEIPLETFIKIVPLIHAEIPNIVRFVYLAGSPRLAIFTDNGQTLYLNITNSEALQEQFKKYHTLQEHYENFGKLWTIDLGSLDESKTIVR